MARTPKTPVPGRKPGRPPGSKNQQTGRKPAAAKPGPKPASRVAAKGTPAKAAATRPASRTISRAAPVRASAPKAARPAAATTAAKPGRKPTGRTAARAVTARQPARARGTSPAAPREPAISKQALRDQVEKLERANAGLRVKAREATRAARDATGRIAELEEQLARLDQSRTGSPEATPTATNGTEGTARRRGRPKGSKNGQTAENAVASQIPAETAVATPPRRRGRRPAGERYMHDPGDAVPPGVAVADPEPEDAEAAAAHRSLDEHLSDEDEG